jgi:hypothetical protein
MKYDEMLFNKYKKITLTKKEVASELNISVSTLDRCLDNLPLRFKRIGDSQKAKYIFPLKAVADYLEYVA